MRRFIRTHLRDAVALVLLAAVGLGVGGYILSNQRFEFPSWVPFAPGDGYIVEAEFRTAQAVVPGQGQTVNIAGVKVGDIEEVRLEDGRAVVRMELERKFRGRVFRDATILLRPKTGLKDMLLQLDPGTRAAGELADGGRIPVSNTLPDVNLDEVLGSLDDDARAYLTILLNAGAEGLGTERAERDLRATLRRFEPTNRDLRRVTRLLAERRRNVRRVIHSLAEVTEELAGSDDELRQFVDASNASLQAFAQEDASIRAALTELPPTLTTARDSLLSAEELASELGPAFEELRPVVREAAPALREVRPFLAATTPVVRDQLRPFARDVQDEVRLLRRTAADLAPSADGLLRTTRFLNALLNTLAHNPAGSEEGYLFWATWASHNGAHVFGTQDAHGPIRRGLFLASCTSLGVLEEIGQTNPNLQLLIDLLGAPSSTDACPQEIPEGGGP